MSVSIIEARNNFIKIQEMYSLFFNVVNKFLKLLEPQNNSYKNVEYYITYINDLLNEDNMSITKCTTFMIMTIFHESQKYSRYNNNDNNKLVRSFEKDIINDAICILENEHNLQHIIQKINNILISINIENYYEAYKEKFGCELCINYDTIYEINYENIKTIYENFHKIKRLTIIMQEDIYYSVEEINDIDNYLFCLFYYVD